MTTPTNRGKSDKCKAAQKDVQKRWNDRAVKAGKISAMKKKARKAGKDV